MRFQNHRNFGYGRTIRFAAKNALREMYYDGHYSSVASHCARWSIFIEFIRTLGITDAQKISQETLVEFFHELKRRVSNRSVSVKYAVNIISSINTILMALRGNKKIWLKPSLIGTVSTVRKRPPRFINADIKKEIIERLKAAGHLKLASMLDQADEFGFRLKEAILHDAKSAAASARKTGSIEIERGTKGGQKRTILVTTTEQFTTLDRAKENQVGANSIPTGQTYASFRRQVYRIFREFGICGQYSFRELRATYASREYQSLTGHPAPVLGGCAPKDIDRYARQQIAEQLGHHRIDVCSSYFGKRKK